MTGKQSGCEQSEEGIVANFLYVCSSLQHHGWVAGQVIDATQVHLPLAGRFQSRISEAADDLKEFIV